MSETYVYDKAKYHMTGGRGAAPSWEHAAGSVLFMLRWFMDHDLVSSYFLEESGSSLEEYRSGRLSLFQLYEDKWDTVFTNEMLSEEGNAFARDYFDYDHGRYTQDLWANLGLAKSDYPLYGEEAYLRFEPLLNSRYAEWKAGNLEAVRLPPKTKGQKRIRKLIGVLIVIGMFAVVFWLIWLVMTAFVPR